jgi:hypothetical protein
MEKRITSKIDLYITTFKEELKKRIEKCDNISLDEKNNFLEFLYNYQHFKLTKEDTQKRKRVKNIVPIYERCTAKRANGEQCTRRRKNGVFCGTHIKGTPHGIMTNIQEGPSIKKISVWAEDIKGIVYYIDENKNVYDPQDIYENKTNPKIIAKWEKTEKDEIYIPQLAN